MSKTIRDTYSLPDVSNNDLVAELYTRYGKKLYGYAIHSWHVKDDAAWDLVYKTLYKIIASHKKYTFENEEKFASFVFRVFINYLRNHYRDTRNTAEDFRLDDMDGNTLQDSPDSTDTEQSKNLKLVILNEELENMEDWQRILLLMRSDGKTYAEIATYVNKPEEQLKVYYQRLKQHITKKINERL